ncbi:hypothetical protein QRX60_17485 [Amycolatopsis mongoliensis]|uniref:Uncharacterized protein n=1 Tax=Amycolatopsis mongoliensis TaxID=715475 RepID=A0A9Y2NKY7_9PSEU|nr:hypothetical protein [Amycolatopsis sp. 4-36]WIY05549.1 hypothetical protein QRX60_17485 [Amycolatopsis sp. 4-36]
MPAPTMLRAPVGHLRADAPWDATRHWTHLMTTPGREDTASDAVLIRESLRDTADDYAARFFAGLAAEKEQEAEADADTAAAARRTELEELVDDHDHGYSESSHRELDY